MLETGNKFNKDTPLFSPDQVSRIFDELKISPNKSNKPTAKPAGQDKPEPTQSVEDILKNNFIEEEP